MILQRVKDLREDNDKKQKHLAVVTGVTPRAYAYYESGERAMPIEVLIKIAQFYSVSTDYLLGLTDVKKPYPPAKC